MAQDDAKNDTVDDFNLSFCMFSKGSGKVMDVTGGSVDNSAKIIQYKFHGGSNQAFNFVKDLRNPGYYAIESVKSGKVMDISGGSTKEGAELIQYGYHGGDNQLFKIEKVDETWYRIIVKKSGLVLDVEGGKTDDKTQIIQWKWHGGDNQLWTFVRSLK